MFNFCPLWKKKMLLLICSFTENMWETTRSGLKKANVKCAAFKYQQPTECCKTWLESITKLLEMNHWNWCSAGEDAMEFHFGGMEWGWTCFRTSGAGRGTLLLEGAGGKLDSWESIVASSPYSFFLNSFPTWSRKKENTFTENINVDQLSSLQALLAFDIRRDSVVL